MNLLQEHNKKYQFFHDITGVAMKVYNKYRPGLLESAYEAALKYLLEIDGYKVERQVLLLELKAVNFVDKSHRRQLWNYMNLTHQPYGMLINFGPEGLFSEWYERYDNGDIEKVRLI